MILGEGETSSRSPVNPPPFYFWHKISCLKTKPFVPQLRMQLKMQMPERVHIVLMSLKVYMKNQNLFRFKGGTSLGGRL